MSDQHNHLILKFLSGTATVDEQQQLEAWASGSAENRKILQDFQKIWQENSEQSVPDFKTNDEWLKLKGLLDHEKHNVRKISIPSVVFKIAASLLAVAVVAVLLYVTWFRTGTITEQSADKRREVLLPDGSAVWLNTNSQISYTSDFDRERNVTLTGEAFFEVTPDPAKPFVISTGAVAIKVLGTSFNVKAYEKDNVQEVYVATGKVHVRSEKGSVDLVPGDLGVLSKNDLTLISSRPDEPNAIAWKTRQLVFKKTNLTEVATTLEHYFRISITIKNPVLEKCRFTSSFNNPTLEEVIEAISLSLSLDVVRQNQEYVWDGEGCGEDVP